MGVDNAIAEALDQLSIHDAHEAGEHDVIGLVGGDLLFEGAVPRRAVCVVAGLHQEGGHAGGLGAFDAQAGLVGANSRNVEGKLARRYGVENGLKIRSGSGYHNHNSHPTSIAHLTCVAGARRDGRPR